jgi:hypothetical protein
VLQGLPFLIGEGSRAFLALGTDLNPTPLMIPIQAAAYCIIVAHRLLGSRLLSGGPIGAEVADYLFRLSDGSEHHTPIRERFEISDLASFGQHPFLAVTDGKHGLQDRWTGPWSAAGLRQTESVTGQAYAYYLWFWRNPRPGVAIESLEIVPRGPRFLVAGITLGLTDEEPFVRDGAVPVRIDLKQKHLAARPLEATGSSLQVEVDRGTAGYVHQLPERSSDEFLADAFAGWGEPQNTTSSPAYAEIAALPSATVAVTFGADTVDSVRWGDLIRNGTVETEQLRVQIVEDGRNWVETLVVDDATGQPVPCRVHFRSPHGVPYQPHGHHHHVNSNNDTWHVDVGGDLRLGQISYAYINGRCQGWLPRGQVLVDVARGYEYEPLRQRYTIEPGQRRLELRLRRWINMNERRWFSGDTHVHFLSTEGGLLEGRAEDLNIVNLLQSQWGSLFTNAEDFNGEPVTSRDGRTLVWTSQENRQHILGHMILLGLTEPIYPWCSGGPGEAELGGTLETHIVRLGRRLSRPGRHRHLAALPESQWGTGGAGCHRTC